MNQPLSLLGRAMRQTAPALCIHCGLTLMEHRGSDCACPHPDGSGFSLNRHFTRARTVSEVSAQLDELEAMSDATGELTADLEELA